MCLCTDGVRVRADGSTPTGRQHCSGGTHGMFVFNSLCLCVCVLMELEAEVMAAHQLAGSFLALHDPVLIFNSHASNSSTD